MRSNFGFQRIFYIWCVCVLIDLFLVQIFVLSCKTKEKDAIFRCLALDDSNVINMHKVSAKKYPINLQTNVLGSFNLFFGIQVKNKTMLNKNNHKHLILWLPIMPDNINFLNNKKYQFFSLGILVFYQYLKMSDIDFINVNQ